MPTSSNQLVLVQRGLMFTLSLFGLGTILIFIIQNKPIDESFYHAAELILATSVMDQNPYMALVNIGLGTFGVVMVWVWGWAFMDFLYSGGLAEFMGASRMKAEVSKLKGHYIICGAGRTGQVIASLLAKAGKKFVFVDRDSKALETFKEKYYLVEGDVTDEDVLKRAGIERAAGLFSVVNSDSENLVTVLLAHELKPDMPICARASHKQSIARVKTAGAKFVVSPAMVCGEELAVQMLGQNTPKGYFGSRSRMVRVKKTGSGG